MSSGKKYDVRVYIDTPGKGVRLVEVAMNESMHEVLDSFLDWCKKENKREEQWKAANEARDD